LLTRLRAAYSIDLALRDLFAARTVTDQALLIEERLLAQLTGTAAESAWEPRPPANAGALPAILHRLPNGLDIWCRNAAEAEFFYRDIFERRIYLQHGITLPPNSCIFDVGANIGLFSLFVHCELACGSLFAFEPSPESAELYRRNAQLHCFAARLFEIGLGSRNTSAPFGYYPLSSCRMLSV
jgi:hypothetical protein